MPDNKETDPLQCWVCSHKVTAKQTTIGLLLQRNGQLLPRQIITLPMPRVDSELMTVLELLKRRIPDRHQSIIEIGLERPSIAYRLLRGQTYTPTQNQTSTLNQIDKEIKRLCPTRQTVSVYECPFNRVGFLNNLKDSVSQG